MVDTPSFSNFLASSVAQISVSLAQPSVATRPSLASIPTAILPGYLLAASRTSEGFSAAAVPRIIRSRPLESHISIVSISLIPPPNWIGILHLLIICSTASALTGFPSKAPFKSTRCSHWHP